MKKKKTNPRRIPLAKKNVNKDILLEEAMQDDMTHAWLLVANTMVEQQQNRDKWKKQRQVEKYQSLYCRSRKS